MLGIDARRNDKVEAVTNETRETRETRVPSPRELKELIEAERTGVPFLHWRDGDGGAADPDARARPARVTIGRREQSDVSLPWDLEVSRAHALLEPVGEEWTLVDDGLSRNGSFVNGSRVHGRQRLHNRDRMCFGNTHVIYHEPVGAEGSDSTARAHGSPGAVAPLRDAAQGADRPVPADGRLELRDHRRRTPRSPPRCSSASTR